MAIQEMRWCRLAVPFFSSLNCRLVLGLYIVQVGIDLYTYLRFIMVYILVAISHLRLCISVIVEIVLYD